MKKLLLAAFAIFAFSPLYAKKVNLEMNLEKGATYYQNMNTDMVVGMNLMGFDMDMNMVMKFGCSFTVTDVTDEGYEMSVAYDRVATCFDMAMFSMSYDSDSPDETKMPGLKILGSMIGQSFDITMSRKGAILDVRNIENLTAAINKAIEEAGLSEEQKERMASQMGQVMDPEALVHNMISSGAVFPDVPVSKGDSWEKASTSSLPFAMTTEAQYRFEGKKRGKWLITGQSNTGGTNREMAKINMNDVSMDLSGKITTTLSFDSKTGWIHQSEATVNFMGSVDVKSASVPVSVSGTMTTEGGRK